MADTNSSLKIFSDSEEVITRLDLIENRATTLETSTGLLNDKIDESVVGLYDHQGGYDVLANSPDLETPSAGVVKKAYAYTCTTAGTFFTEEMEVGDVIIANSDDPSSLSDWTRVNKNFSFGTTAGTACEGNDSRLSDSRDPNAHATEHTDGTDDIQDATASQKGLATAAQITKLDAITGTNTGDEVDATTTVKGIVELATDGESSAGVVVQGNDSRLSDDRNDANAIHDNVSGEINAVSAKGSPVVGDKVLIEDSEASWVKKSLALSTLPSIIKLDDLAEPDDNTDLDASTSKHGLMQKYPGGTTTFLRADGSFAIPSGLVTSYTTEITGAESFVVTYADAPADGEYWQLQDGNGDDFFCYFGTLPAGTGTAINCGSVPGSATDAATATASVITTSFSTYFTASADGTTVTITNVKGGTCDHPIDVDANVSFEILTDGTGTPNTTQIWSGSAGDYSYEITAATHGISITDYDVNVLLYDENGDRVILDYNVASDDDITIYSPTSAAVNVVIK